ncbi:hypothetical protein B0H14DRAFT_3471520 [Mycena olivaceomarginata]|nr:hypothetical protein B0H14DRAFT_3471520 [Mycena olivaceomarginata]
MPVLPPFALPSASPVRTSGFALPGASSPSSAHGATPPPGAAASKFLEGIASSTPAPVATEGSWSPVQSEGRWRRPLNTPAVPGSTPINLGLAEGAPDFVTPCAPQGAVAPGAGVADGKDAPLPLDAPHFTVVDSGAASEGLAPWGASQILFRVAVSPRCQVTSSQALQDLKPRVLQLRDVLLAWNASLF